MARSAWQSCQRHHSQDRTTTSNLPVRPLLKSRISTQQFSQHGDIGICIVLTMRRAPASTRVTAIAQHKGQAPALRTISSHRIKVWRRVREIWLCRRNALPTEMGKVGYLVPEHFCDGVRLENRRTSRWRFAFVEKCSQNFWTCQHQILISLSLY